MKPITKGEVPATRTTRQIPSIQRGAITSLSLCMLLSSLGVSIPNIALPTLAKAFSASFQEVQWIIIAYLLAVTILIVSIGRIGDILGHRPVVLSGITLFIFASLLCGAAPALWVLVSGRVIQGIGAAILMALTVALVREIVPKEKTGSAMGLLGTMSAIGTALGPSLGGILLAGPGWRAIFYTMAALSILTFLLAYRYLPVHEPRRESQGNGFDIKGTLLLGITLATYALSVTMGGGHFNWLNIALLLGAVLGGSLFIFIEAKVDTPLIHLTTFRNMLLNTSLATNAIISTVMMATLVIGPFYLSRALGLNEALVGIVMSIGPVISSLSGVPAGRIVDRFGAPSIIITGLIEMAVGTFALALLPAKFGISGYIIALAILTPGYQLFQAANNTAVIMDVHQNQRGIISALLSLSRNLGLISGASVMGAVFTFTSMTPDISLAPPGAVANGFQITFTVAAIMILIALAIVLKGRMLTKGATY